MKTSGYTVQGNATIDETFATIKQASPEALIDQVEALAKESKEIHERQCFNLNPATNIMNPRAEALLASGLGTRPSLGHPGVKYEMGLEAIEKIEVIASSLAAQVFNAKFAEIRVPSGAIANLYAFMATCKAGDDIIVPPASIGGHVTHHFAGCAGLYGLKSHEAKVAEDGYTVDVEALRAQAQQLRPKLITIGGSLNLEPHPVKDIVEIAHEVGAKVLFDAAHQCGMIAGGAWKNPLDEGADMMSMSTYKSLGGPPSGLIVTNDEGLAKRLDAIAFPGMTANFDVAKSAALAVTLADWQSFGAAYAKQMIVLSKALSQALEDNGIEIFKTSNGATQSHQFAALAAPLGGGQAASAKLRKSGFLACGIGLPIAAYPNDLNGLRLGTPELARIGMTVDDMPRLADIIAKSLKSNDPEGLASEVENWRQSFSGLQYIHA